MRFCTQRLTGRMRKMPEQTLKNVVLPAPFGPMIPKISPALTVMLTLLTALSPPKSKSRLYDAVLHTKTYRQDEEFATEKALEMPKDITCVDCHADVIDSFESAEISGNTVRSQNFTHFEPPISDEIFPFFIFHPLPPASTLSEAPASPCGRTHIMAIIRTPPR